MHQVKRKARQAVQAEKQALRRTAAEKRKADHMSALAAHENRVKCNACGKQVSIMSYHMH